MVACDLSSSFLDKFSQSLGCKTLCIVANFLVLLSIFQSFSVDHSLFVIFLRKFKKLFINAVWVTVSHYEF